MPEAGGLIGLVSTTVRSLSFSRRSRREGSCPSMAESSPHSDGQPAQSPPAQAHAEAAGAPDEARRATRRTSSFGRRRSSHSARGDDALPPAHVRVLTVDKSALVLPTTLHTTVGQLVRTCASELGLAEGAHSSFALFSVQHDGTHLLLSDELLVAAAALPQARPSGRPQMLGLISQRAGGGPPLLLFKKRLFVGEDEALLDSPRFLHLVYIQAVDDLLRGDLDVRLVEAINLAAVLCFVRFGPCAGDGAAEWSAEHMCEQRLVEQLVPCTLFLKTHEAELASNILRKYRKYSERFASREEAKKTFLGRVRAPACLPACLPQSAPTLPGAPTLPAELRLTRRSDRPPPGRPAGAQAAAVRAEPLPRAQRAALPVGCLLSARLPRGGHQHAAPSHARAVALPDRLCRRDQVGVLADRVRLLVDALRLPRARAGGSPLGQVHAQHQPGLGGLGGAALLLPALHE